MQDSSPGPSAKSFSEQLAHAPAVFFSEPFSFSWWLRGGEPGSPSDKLTLESDGRTIMGTYVRARFDPKREPPTYSEKFSRAVDTKDVSAILKGLFDSQLFWKHLKEQDDRGMRDVQKETWTFARGNNQYSKTLFDPPPDSLMNVRSLIRELTKQIADKGAP